MNIRVPYEKADAAPLVVSTDPVTGCKIEYHSLEHFAQSCIDEQAFKVKPESYICSKLPDYNCENCIAFPLVNPKKLTEVTGYRIGGIVRKFDITQEPFKEIDSKKVSFLIGKGQIAANTNKQYMSYVLGTDNIGLFMNIAKAGEAVVFNKNIDRAYQIINKGMPESIFRMIVGFNEPEQNQDLFIKLDESFLSLSENQVRQFFLEKKQRLIKSIDPDTFEQHSVDEVVAQIPKIELLPKGHLAKPMKWENGHFHITEDGVFFVDEDKNGISQKRFISSPVLLVAKTRDSSSNNWGVLLKWTDDSGIEHAQALSMELFQTDGADLRKALAYQGVMIAPDSRARNLFQCYLMSYQIEKYALCVDRVGWHGDVFVLPHECIGQSRNGDLIVYQANHGLNNGYQSKGTLEQWRSDVSQLVQTHSKLVFALCTAFSGQLLDPLNQQGGGFHFKGGSSKGKTTALHLACSVWGNPKQFYRSWKATGNFLEHTAHMHNDGLLVLDEMGEIAYPKELGNISYMLSNGMGKGRMTQQITAKPMHQWRVIFLSSGEKSLKEIMQEEGQKTKLGQEIRLVDIDIDQVEHGIFDQIDFAEDGAKQSIELVSRINQSYGVAGIAWLKYLTSNKTERMSEARELSEQYRKVLTVNQSQGHIVRVANYFALVATAGELAIRAGITGWKAGTAFNAVQKVFNQWLGSFEQVGDYENREIVAHVKAFFEANESSRFEAITPDPDYIERINNRVGYWKMENGEKIFYVLPEQFKNEVCKGYDSRKVAKALLAYNLLEHDIGKTSKTARIPSRKNTVKVYAVKEAIFSWE